MPSCSKRPGAAATPSSTGARRTSRCSRAPANTPWRQRVPGRKPSRNRARPIATCCRSSSRSTASTRRATCCGRNWRSLRRRTGCCHSRPFRNCTDAHLTRQPRPPSSRRPWRTSCRTRRPGRSPGRRWGGCGSLPATARARSRPPATPWRRSPRWTRRPCSRCSSSRREKPTPSRWWPGTWAASPSRRSAWPTRGSSSTCSAIRRPGRSWTCSRGKPRTWPRPGC